MAGNYGDGQFLRFDVLRRCIGKMYWDEALGRCIGKMYWNDVNSERIVVV